MKLRIFKNKLIKNNIFFYVFVFVIFALFFLTNVSAAKYIEPIDTSEPVEVNKEVTLHTTITDLIYELSCELRVKKGGTLLDTVNATNSGLVISAKYTFELAGNYKVYFKCFDKDNNPKSGSEANIEVRAEVKKPVVEQLNIETAVELAVQKTFQTIAKDDSGIDYCTFFVEDDLENLIDEKKADVSKPCTNCSVSESFKFNEIGRYYVYFSCVDNEKNEGIAEKELIFVKEDVIKPVVSKIVAPEDVFVGKKQRFEAEVSDNKEVDMCWFVVENKNEDQIVKKKVSVGYSCDSCIVKTDYVFNVKDDFYVYFKCKDAESNEIDGIKTKISKDIIEFPQVLSLVSKNCTSLNDDFLTTCSVRIKDFSDSLKCVLYDQDKSKSDFDEVEQDCNDTVAGCDCSKDEDCSCSSTQEGCVYEFKEIFKFSFVQYPSVGISCVNNENDELDRLVQSFAIVNKGAPTHFVFNINGKIDEYTNSKEVYLLARIKGAIECVFRAENEDYGSWVKYTNLDLSLGIREPWILPSSNGEKTVCGKCRSEGGVESGEKCTSIYLDLIPPSVVLVESGDLSSRIINESQSISIPSQVKAVVSDVGSGVNACQFKVSFDSEVLANVFTKIESGSCFYDLPSELAELDIKEDSLLKLTLTVFDNIKNKTTKTLVFFGTDVVEEIIEEPKSIIDERTEGVEKKDTLESANKDSFQENQLEEIKHSEELGDFSIVLFEPSSIKGVKRGDYVDVLVELRGGEIEDSGINLVLTGPSGEEYQMEKNYNGRFIFSKQFYFDKKVTEWILKINAFDGYGEKLNAKTLETRIPIVNRFENVLKKDNEGILLKINFDLQGNKTIVIEKESIGYMGDFPEKILLIPLDKYGNQLVDLKGEVVTLEAVKKEEGFEFKLESYLLKMTSQLQISDEFGNSSKLKVKLENENLVEANDLGNQRSLSSDSNISFLPFDFSQLMPVIILIVGVVGLVVLVIFGFKAKKELLLFYRRKKSREQMLNLKKLNKKNQESMDKFIDKSNKDMREQNFGKNKNISNTNNKGVSLNNFEKYFKEVKNTTVLKENEDLIVKPNQNIALDSSKNIAKKLEKKRMEKKVNGVNQSSLFDINQISGVDKNKPYQQKNESNAQTEYKSVFKNKTSVQSEKKTNGLLENKEILGLKGLKKVVQDLDFREKKVSYGDVNNNLNISQVKRNPFDDEPEEEKKK